MNDGAVEQRVAWWPMVLIAAATIGLLYIIRESLSPLVLALIMAYLLNPLVDIGERRSLPRWVTISIIYLLIGAILVVAIAFAVPALIQQLQDIRELITVHWPKLPTYLDDAAVWTEQNVPYVGPIIADPEIGSRALSTIQEWLSRALEQAPTLLTSALSNLVNVVSYFVIVPFIAFFLMRDGRQFIRSGIQLVPNRYFEVTLNVLGGIGESVGRYLRGLLLEASILSLVAIIGLLSIGLEYAVIVGIVAGITNLIPYLGPTMGILVGSTVALLTGGNVLGVLIVFAIAQFLDNWVVQPVVMSRSVHLHPLVIFMAVIFGGTYGGILGMVVAVPLTGVVIVSVRRLREGLQPPVYPYELDEEPF